MNLIVIEANIGVGKTHLTGEIAELLSATPWLEPVETNPYLELYYKDPKRWGLEMQYYLMSRRFEDHQKAIESIWRTQKPCVFDRSIYGDLAFAILNHEIGNIDDLGWKAYTRMRNMMFRFLLAPQFCIYLDCEPGVAFGRIQHRGRECETGITLEYLEGLQRAYAVVLEDLENRGTKIIRIDYNKFVPAADIVGMLKL